MRIFALAARTLALARRAARWLVRQVRLRAFPREKRHALVGQPHLWMMKRDFQIAFLTDVGLKPEHYLLDIGCGTLRGGIPIIRYLEEGHYFGFDTRPDAIEEARKELEAESLTSKAPVLTCAPNISSLDLGRTFDYVWAFSVLIHMTDEIVEDCFAFVARHIAPHGMFYANVNAGVRPPKTWRGFPVVWRTLASYQRLGAAHALTVKDIGPLSAFGHVTGIAEQDDQRVLEMRVARADDRPRQRAARPSVSATS
jgi:SAM-dependent methyltransferase